MNHPDERVQHRNSSLTKALYYVVGSIISAAIIFAGLQIFHDYFYGEGLNKVLPSLILLLGSLAIGFFCAKRIVQRFARSKGR